MTHEERRKTIKAIYAILKVLHMNAGAKDEFVDMATGGRTNHLTECTDEELVNVMTALRNTEDSIKKRTRGDEYYEEIRQLDFKRKKVIAAVFGYCTIKGLGNVSVEYVKGIIEKAAGKEINSIPEKELDKLWMQFTKKGQRMLAEESKKQ